MQGSSGVDWIEFTIPTPTEVDRHYYYRRWATLLHGAMPQDNGMMGYDRVFTVLGTGKIMYASQRLSQGFHVILPAKSLAVWNEIHKGEATIYRLLIEAKNDNARFTRLDICHDTPNVHISKFLEAIESDELVTPSHQILLQKGLRGNGGTTIYIGSPNSDRRVRIYDKAAEQGVEGVWTRIETQYRKKYADQVVDYILMSDVSMESLAAGSIDFREPTNTRTNNRPRCEWWAALLADFERIEFVIEKVVKTLEEKAQWLERQIMPTLAAVFLAFGGEWFQSAMDEGVRRITPCNRALIYSTA